MASAADIRKKIRSVKNTEKITTAMKMVAASKLRRAEENMRALRPYADSIGAMLHRVAALVPTEPGQAPHPLLEVPDRPKRVLILVVTSDRGLCGGFNNNTLRMAEKFIAERRPHYESVEVATIGRRAADHFRKRDIAAARNFPGVFDDLSFRRATELAEGITEEYMNTDLDAVFVIYNEFKSAVSQILRSEQVLPISEAELPAGESAAEYIFERNPTDVLNKLVPNYLAIGIYHALLESWASEQGARMSAMENASKNARDMVDDLTLIYNRARQAGITTDLMDIIGGAEALKG